METKKASFRWLEVNLNLKPIRQQLLIHYTYSDRRLY